jgi:hypothetical protein
LAEPRLGGHFRQTKGRPNGRPLIFSAATTASNLVAGTGFEPVTFRL